MSNCDLHNKIVKKLLKIGFSEIDFNDQLLILQHADSCLEDGKKTRIMITQGGDIFVYIKSTNCYNLVYFTEDACFFFNNAETILRDVQGEDYFFVVEQKEYRFSSGKVITSVPIFKYPLIGGFLNEPINMN